MLEMFLEALLELLGVKPEAKRRPPPNRQARRQAARETAAPQGSFQRVEQPEPEQQQGMTFEDFVRQITGETESEPEAPPPPPPPPEPKRVRFRSEPSRIRAPRPQAVLAVEEPAVLQGTLQSMPQVSVAEPLRPRRREDESLAFVDRLRGNPSAAREAFVYAEIFGPPLADRSPESKW